MNRESTKQSFRFADGITAMGMQPLQMSWLDRPPVVNLMAAKRLLQMLGALEGERLSAQGQKMAAPGQRSAFSGNAG
ncbi:hypothetical protein ACVXHB_19595 [Escherichia coli]